MILTYDVFSNRTIYWTKCSFSTGNGGIVKALMDGTNSGQIISGLSYPKGITVDYKTSRLFWVEGGKGTIQYVGWN